MEPDSDHLEMVDFRAESKMVAYILSRIRQQTAKILSKFKIGGSSSIKERRNQSRDLIESSLFNSLQEEQILANDTT